jgi:hypothetical protein
MKSGWTGDLPSDQRGLEAGEQLWPPKKPGQLLSEEHRHVLRIGGAKRWKTVTLPRSLSDPHHPVKPLSRTSWVGEGEGYANILARPAASLFSRPLTSLL